MKQPRKVILGKGSGEITEKKSRFIATVMEVHTEQEALQLIEDLRKKYWDAKHNCYAFVVGAEGEVQRFSDDKEPQGTAGKPILDVILGAGLSNICIVVTRYFGGILLGTGGLIRAYTQAAAAGLSGSCILPVQKGIRTQLKCEYTLAGKIQYLITKEEIPLICADYLDKVTFTLAVPDKDIDRLSKKVTELSSGSVSFSGSEEISFVNGPEGVVFYHF